MQSIIQSKVPPAQQGRVFGALLFTSQISAPLAMVFAGPLADDVFASHGAPQGIALLLEPVTGGGPGSGMAAMLLIAGCCGIVAAVVGLTGRSVRHIDLLIPDLKTADAGAAPASVEATAR
jgi:MFS transporter, DHA3 family, macrolide efflux protein